MRYLQLAGKKITALALGLDKFSFSEQEMFCALAEEYLSLGGNNFDTAHIYAAGESEQLLGDFLAKRGIRDRVFVGTKIGFPDREDHWRSRLSFSELEGDLNLSLERLQMDFVDLLWLHRDDESRPVEEILLDLNRLAKKGGFRAIGASNFTAERIQKANLFAKKEGLMGFSASQIQWSAAETREEIYRDHGICIMNRAEYDRYLTLGIPVFCYAPLAGGYFNKLIEGRAMSEKLATRFDSPENRKRAEKVSGLAEEKGCSLAAASLLYLAQNKLETVVITGAKKIPHLQESFEAFSLSANKPYTFPF